MLQVTADAVNIVEMVNVVAEEGAVVEVTAVDLGLRAVLHLPHLPLLPPAPLQSQMPQPKPHFRCNAPTSGIMTLQTSCCAEFWHLHT